MKAFPRSPLPRIALVGLLAASLPLARAATIDWSGNADGDFADAARWAGGAVPGAGDTANVPAGTTATVAIRGAARQVGRLQMRGKGTYAVAMDPGAVLSANVDICGTGRMVVEKGTVDSRDTLVGGEFGHVGMLILKGGNFHATAGSFNINGGVSKELYSCVQVNAGSTLTFSEEERGFVFTIGNSVCTPTVQLQKCALEVNGGTVTISGSANEMKVGAWGGASTSEVVAEVNVTSGTLNTFVDSEKGRILVGSRARSALERPEADFAECVAQVNVSGTGVLNAGGDGLWIGRNKESTPGRLNVTGGEANLGGVILGNLGRITQSKGVLRFNANKDFVNEAQDGQPHLFMTGGVTQFQGLRSSEMTIAAGDARAGNALGKGFHNVEFGAAKGGPFRITLAQEFYGRGTANGGNGVEGDGIMDLKVWPNVTIVYKNTTYKGTGGANSLLAFGQLAKSWGWDFVLAKDSGR
jgi:hypothetical protein